MLRPHSSLTLRVVIGTLNFCHLLLDLEGSWGQVNEGEAEGGARRHAEYRAFAVDHPGSVERGKIVFQDLKKAACSKCHSLDGTHNSVGPDLSSIGDKFRKPDLITSVLEPSKTIAVGFSTTVVVTNAGLTHQGILSRMTGEWIELQNNEAKEIRIPLSEIEERRTSKLSLMPIGLEAQVSREEFSDLIAFLGSLKQTSSSITSGNVIQSIARATKPAALQPFFAATIRFDHPVWFGEIPGESAHLVVEQGGKIFVVRKQEERNVKSLVLDISRNVRGHNATGLLGLALHPQFSRNGRYFIKYQCEQRGQITTVIEERRFVLGKLNSDESYEPRKLLAIDGSTPDHNGGCLTFGPDGYLYIGMGDSGPQRDPQGHGQDMKTHLGKILRIDVDHFAADKPYGIPADNPFNNESNAKPEIWAFGFREPWRFSFDAETKDLWVGDVGQDRFEEVAIVRSGENHGWNIFEGAVEHSNQFRKADAKYVAPILTYPRRLGVSVTGGHVYRGEKSPRARGWYIFGDFESRRLWALKQKDRALEEIVEIGVAPSRVVSFAEGKDGELFLVGYDDGLIYRLDLAVVDLTPLRTKVLAETSERAPVEWKFTTTAPQDGWMRNEFDDAAWKSGPGGFGTRGTPGAVVRTDWNGQRIWLRRNFELPADFASDASIRLVVHHDEDAVVYVNGVEAAQLPRWTNGYVEVPLQEDAVKSLRVGMNTIAIECRQTGGGQFIDAGLIQAVATPK